MRHDIDRPKEKTFKILLGQNHGSYIQLRKKKTRWHVASDSLHVSYSQEELDELIKDGWLEERS